MFTIIVPTHDRPLLLRRALQSLIAQTFKDFTVIVVDDAASYIPPFDELAALQGRYVYVIRSGVSGPAESRNMGLALAKSKYLIFLDDDDSLEPGHLQALANAVRDDAPELLFCDFKVQTEDRTASPPKVLALQEASIADATVGSVYVRNRIPNSCLVYRRDIVGDTRYDTALPMYEDWDFLLSCLKKATLRHLPISSVVIHKSHGEAQENLRRGNGQDDKIFGMTLYLFRKYPAPDLETRLARQNFLTQAGVAVGLELC